MFGTKVVIKILWQTNKPISILRLGTKSYAKFSQIITSERRSRITDTFQGQFKGERTKYRKNDAIPNQGEIGQWIDPAASDAIQHSSAKPFHIGGVASITPSSV